MPRSPSSSSGDARANRWGVTPLHLASSPRRAARLLARGASSIVADVDAESGWTPLHRALHRGHLRVAAVLLERGGASLHSPADHRGRTPLDLLTARCKRLLPWTSAWTSPWTSQQREATPCDVYSWGSGVNFQLGTGAVDDAPAPRRLDVLAVASPAPDDDDEMSDAIIHHSGGGVLAVSCSKFHGLAACADGTLRAWGHGRGGRLGLRDAKIHDGDEAVLLPRRVRGFGVRRRVVTVAAGKHHSLVATDDGECYAWGLAADGRLGYVLEDDAADVAAAAAAAETGSQPTPRRVRGALERRRVVAVAASNRYSVVVTSDGEAFSFGCNARGQLGHGQTGIQSAHIATPRAIEQLKPRRVASVSAAKHHAVATTADGTAWQWGRGDSSATRVRCVLYTGPHTTPSAW